jgi:hypothetical protein
MLVKLELSKIYFLVIFLLLSSCSSKKPIKFTELDCNNNKILIRFASADEVMVAIENFFIQKKKENGTENYTIIQLPDNRSFKIENLPPEEAMRCKIHDFSTSLQYKYYEKYYH